MATVKRTPAPAEALRGLPQAMVSGRAADSVAGMGSLGSVTTVILDPDIKANMSIFAAIIGGTANQLVITKATAAAGQVTLQLSNTSGGAQTGTVLFAYWGY